MNKLDQFADTMSPSYIKEVRVATIDDIPGIMSVLEDNLIANKKQDTCVLEKTGFLIHGFTAEEAQVAILDKNHFIYLVTTENDEVIGYTVGCDIKILKPIYQERLASISPAISNALFSERVFYLRHIAKKQGKIHVGKELLQELIDRTKRAGYQSIICQIADKPVPNKGSKLFHEKYGFICVGYSENEEGSFGVYFKRIM